LPRFHGMRIALSLAPIGSPTTAIFCKHPWPRLFIYQVSKESAVKSPRHQEKQAC
jgi:hypothetical protein